MTRRTCLLDTERPLLHAHGAMTITRVTGFGCCTGLGTRTRTRFALFPAGNTNFRIETIGSLFKADIQCVFKVAATVHLRPTTLTATTKNIAENIAENITKASTTRTASAPRVGVNTSMTKAIISRTLAFIRKHFVGFFGFFKLVFGLDAIWVSVRVVLHGEPTVSFS